MGISGGESDAPNSDTLSEVDKTVRGQKSSRKKKKVRVRNMGDKTKEQLDAKSTKKGPTLLVICSCGQKVVKGGIECEICKRWYHYNCEGLSEDALTAIGAHRLFWMCQECKKFAGKYREVIASKASSEDFELRIQSLEARMNGIDEVKKKVDNLGDMLDSVSRALIGQKEVVSEIGHMVKEQLKEAQQASQNDRQEGIYEKMKNLEKGVDEIMTVVTGEAGVRKKLETNLKKVVKDEVKMIKDEVSEAVTALGKERKEDRDKGGKMPSEVVKSVRECMEQEKRRKNIVVHNLEEPDQEQSTAEKNEKDKMAFQEMCKETMRLNTKVDRAFRIGRTSGGRPRLLIIVFEEEVTKWEVLRMARNLRNDEKYSNIYVTPDLTPEEQARDKALRAELKSCRLAGETVEIRRGRIVSKKAEEKKTLPEVETIPKIVE